MKIKKSMWIIINHSDYPISIDDAQNKKIFGIYDEQQFKHAIINWYFLLFTEETESLCGKSLCCLKVLSCSFCGIVSNLDIKCAYSFFLGANCGERNKLPAILWSGGKKLVNTNNCW